MASTTKFYRPELDMLRFFAFFAVFLHHTFSLNTGDYEGTFGHAAALVFSAIANAFGLGLPLFFFLSAFLICTLLILEKREARTIAVRDFYIRRVLRIWPLYFLAILLAMGVAYYGQAIGYHTKAQYGMAAAFALFAGNWFFVLNNFNGNPFEPLWSISVEEQFYLIVPLLLLLIPVRRVGLLSALLLALSAAALFVEGAMHITIGRQIWTDTFSQLMFLAAGIATAWALLSFAAVPRFLAARSGRWRWAAAAAGLALFFVAAYVFEAKRNAVANSGWSVMVGYVFAMLGCLALFAAAYGIRRTPPALIFLGKISFGLYVYHMFSVFLIQLAIDQLGLPHLHSQVALHLISLPLTVGLAWLSYEKFEKAFLRLRGRFTHVRNRPA